MPMIYTVMSAVQDKLQEYSDAVKEAKDRQRREAEEEERRREEVGGDVAVCCEEVLDGSL